MKFFVNNLIFLNKKFKSFFVINILGLSVAFAVFIVTMLQVSYDFSFNKSIKNTEEIYYLSRHLPNTSGFNDGAMGKGAVLNIVNKFPEIEDHMVMGTDMDALISIRTSEGQSSDFTENLKAATVNMLDIFPSEIISGNKSQLYRGLNYAMITESAAKKIFGDQDPIGKEFFIKESLYNPETYDLTAPKTIVAVCKDYPSNSSISNGIYTFMDKNDIFDNTIYRLYVKVSPANYPVLKEKLNAPEYMGKEELQDREYKLTSFADLHFLEGFGKGNKVLTYSLFVIGIIVLIIAFTNFVNLTIAMIPSRIKSINVHKIMGVKKSLQKIAISFEGVFLTTVSFILAVIYIYILRGSEFFTLIISDFSFTDNWDKIIFFGLIVTLLAFIIGLYPAHYATSVKETMTLNGSFSTSLKGVRVRNGLIIFQFLTAIILIIISSFIKVQNDFMKGYSWGIEKENIVYMPSSKLTTNIETFKAELMKNPRIVDFTAGSHLPGAVRASWRRDFEGQQVEFTIWRVYPNFLDFFGVNVTNGEGFKDGDSNEKEKLIFNHKFLDKYGYDETIIGKRFDSWADGSYKAAIVGTMDNIHFESLHEPIKPMAFGLGGEKYGYAFAKITGKDVSSTLQFINKTLKNVSDSDAEAAFLDGTLNDLYKRESNISQLIGVFGIFTVIIAVMGIYGLVMFNAHFKVKEIGLRKVNGATEKEIVLMLNRNLLIQLGIAFVISIPIAYYIVQHWLEQFSYKVPVFWYIFPLTGLTVLFISGTTVSWQSWKAATANPVNALNNE